MELPPVPEMDYLFPKLRNGFWIRRGTEELEASSQGDGLFAATAIDGKIRVHQKYPPLYHLCLRWDYHLFLKLGNRILDQKRELEELEASSEGDGLLPPPSMEEPECTRDPSHFATRAEMGLPLSTEQGDSDSGSEEGAEEPEVSSEGRDCYRHPLRWRN